MEVLVLAAVSRRPKKEKATKMPSMHERATGSSWTGSMPQAQQQEKEAARKGAGKEKIKAAVLRAKMPLEPIFVYTI